MLIISSGRELEWPPFRTQYRCANLHSGCLQFVDVWAILRSGKNLLKLVDLQDALRARIYNGQFRTHADLKKPRLADNKDAFPQLLWNNKNGAMFLIIGDTTGRGDGPSKTNYQ
jgi:hypothetical protein